MGMEHSCILGMDQFDWINFPLEMKQSKEREVELLASGHDKMHRSMLTMYNQQSFMAMINDRSEWSTVFHGND